jgi:hypothetical protein
MTMVEATDLTTERNFRTNLERLRSGTATTATVAAIEHDITTASRQQVDWTLRRLMALRALGLYLMTTPRRGRGRPKKGHVGLFQSLTDRSLRDLGITDNHIATRALNVARICDEIYEAYLASTDEPTEAGLLKYGSNDQTERQTRSECEPIIKQQVWITPKPMYAVLNRLFHFDFDPCPRDRLPDFNSLLAAWKKSNYVNPPFSARNNPEGIGPTDFARKAIKENRAGKSSIIVLPTMNYVNMLLAAGAEPFPLGHVPWLDAETREPQPTPPNITGFILWGSQFSEAEKGRIRSRLATDIPKLGYGPV